MRVPFAFKSVVRRMGRYGFLVAMIALGIAAVTMVQSVTVGMGDNVIEGAARYLGGRWIVIGRRGVGSAQNHIEDPQAILEALEASGIRPSLVARREVAGDNKPTLFFNGASFLVRRVSGVDFEAEAAVFDRLYFEAGGYKGHKGSNAILLSRQVAKRFGLRLGDEVTLRLVNRAGYLDSGRFVVGGIFRDASIFGYYNCYVDYEVMRTLSGETGTACSSLGLYLADDSHPRATALALEAALEDSGFQVLQDVVDRAGLEALWRTRWEGDRYAVLPVEDYIDAKVMDLIKAIQLISYLFLAMILLVILVGMRNTTQMMTRRRFREIGTIRALGMSEGGATRLILGESLLVASLGFLAGLVLAILLLTGLGLVAFDWSDGFDIFLRRGHLSWSLSPLFLFANYLALAAMTVAGAFPAARHAASIPPAAAMTSTD